MSQREKPSSATALALVGGLILVGVIGTIVVGGAAYWFVQQAGENASSVQFQSVADALAAPVDDQPLFNGEAAAIEELQLDLSEESTDTSDSAAVVDGKQRQAVIQAARDVLRAASSFDAETIAWSDESVQVADDGTHVVSGAFTSEGISHRWQCSLRPSRRGDVRAWFCEQLVMDGETISVDY